MRDRETASSSRSPPAPVVGWSSARASTDELHGCDRVCCAGPHLCRPLEERRQHSRSGSRRGSHRNKDDEANPLNNTSSGRRRTPIAVVSRRLLSPGKETPRWGLLLPTAWCAEKGNAQVGVLLPAACMRVRRKGCPS